MGVTVEVWRARIGSYSGSHFSLGSSFQRGSSFRNAAAFAMPLLLITSLLLIGCLETNPGPGPYQCTVCNASFNSVAGYAKHQELHTINKNFMFPCFECGMDMVSVNAFKVHFTRFHSNVPAENPAPGRDSIFTDVLHDTTFKCSLITCQETFRTSRLLRGHMIKHLLNGHVISCPFEPCQNKFTKVSTFRTHMSQYHRALEGNLADEFVGERDGRIYFNNDNEDSDVSDIEDFPFELDVSDNEEEPQQMPAYDPFQEENSEGENIYPDNTVRDHLVKFYLLLEGELVLPSAKVQRISEEIAIMSRISHHQISSALKAEMAKSGIDKKIAEKIIDASLKKDIVYAVHHKNMDVLDLTSQHLRLKAFKQRCPFLNYESIFIGLNDAGKKRYASFIKIKDSLLHMFNDKSIQKEIEASFTREPGTDIYSDFTDGSTFTQHPICSNMESIQIILFQDAFEFVPLSCAAGLYKCVGFYFTLGNMSPETRSKVDSIQLTFLVTETDLKYFTPEVCLEKLINELKDLVENGIEYKGKTLPVVLMHVCGDNLGQNFIGLYTECFTADSACRFCGITNAALKKKPYAILPLRTPEDYDADASQVDPENPRLSCIRGIKGNSPFNQIPMFHVANPGQPPCIGHDILEGIGKKDYALYLKYFIEVKQWFSMEDVNRRISQFRPKGRDAADGFMKLDPKLEKIRGHASEVWLFIRMLPFLIGDKVQDLDDPVWKLCLDLKVICEYVFAPRITSAQLAKLKELVNLYVEKRATIFNKGLQHKHHLVCHYSDLVTYFGVLIRLWTLRFESRHVFFKKAAKAANNFINITTTLANKYVLNFAYKMSSCLVSSNVIFNSKDVSTLNLDELTPPVRNLVRNEPAFDRILKTVTLNSIEYTPGQWIVLGSNGKNLIVGEVTLILSDVLDVKFILKVHEAENTFQGYYAINHMDHHFVSKKLEEFADYYPLSSYKFLGKSCLVLKHSNPTMDSSD